MNNTLKNWILDILGLLIILATILGIAFTDRSFWELCWGFPLGTAFFVLKTSHIRVFVTDFWTKKIGKK